jgi:ATP-binding cassette, subfamily F, member 3
MLHINNLVCRVDGRLLLDNVSFALLPKTRLGLVGRNGTGKSTLLRIIKGELDPISGETRIRKGARVGAVDQEAPGGPQSIMDFVLSADTERQSLLQQAEQEAEPHKIAEIQTRLADIDAYSAEARAGTILHGLGFTTQEQKQPCSSFSGGWRMRASLASMLFAAPDLLLLDEPTNYLDLEGAIWLETHLKRFAGAVFIVSHDRDLLNTAVHQIAHLRGGKVTLFEGGYDSFEKQLAERQRLDMALRGRQEEERRHLQAFVDRFRYKASKAKQAQSRVKRLEKMRPIATIVENPVAPFDLPSPARSMAPPMIRFENASVGYAPGKPVLSNINLALDPDDRIALLGRNGQGKSTFAKLIAGKLAVMSGRMKHHKRMQIAYFAQHQLDVLTPSETPYTHVRERMEEATEAQRRSRLARFGLGAAHAETPVGDLSGGEKARLLLNLIAFDGPHLLILDEPTNHLDMDSRAALADALDEYEGAVLLISHDRFLIERSIDRLWIVQGGTVQPYEGDMEDYRSQMGEKERKAASPLKVNAGLAKRQAQAERREALAPLRRNIEKLESELERLKDGIVQIDAALAKPELYERNPEQATTFNVKRTRALKRIEEVENLWFEAQEALERARNQ